MLTKMIDIVSKRTTDDAGVTTLVPASRRARLWSNALKKEFPILSRVAQVVMSMPVHACSTERNWTQWGAVYVKTRSRLGLQKASDLIYVKQNDLRASGTAADMSDLAVLLDTLTVDLDE